MILNMSYGASQAQFVDFTLTSETTGMNVQIVIPNVKLPTNTVHGLMIYPTSNIAANQNGCIYYAWWNPNIATTLIGYKYHLFDEDGYTESPTGSATSFVYDPVNKTLSTRINGSQTWFFPGNYRLVIW